ncbi:MAG: tRNA (adenosine(37)-N6)-threonylcarbamoyltransferase complex transferase subunit TsaD [Clostridia bacterium]|nr:tRNA (adenosine(37)-N6)-threonylcarbamoyltransferase complex transferase subunit TsaD [Clostridia bacterium]
MKKNLITLAIETSCDETSVAIMKNGRTVLANVIYSQIDIHEKFGGVVPEVASRNHVEKISQIIDQALEEAQVTFDDIDMVGTTYGPGLVGALLVGLSTAKALAYAMEVPLVPVNHIEGHIFANFIEYPDLEPPFLCLVVSGGHTHLVHVMDYGNYEIMGKTRDDAAGEAYDKVARTLGLGYPGGPKIDKMAREGNPEAIHFTRTYLEKDTFDFSFSGIKSGVLNYVNSARQKKEPLNLPDIAASFQASVIDVLTTKTIDAARKAGVDKVALAGGVAANSALRQALVDKCGQEGFEFFYPSLKLCTDNAAMIGCVAYYDYLSGIRGDLNTNAVPNLKIGDK